MTPPPQTPAAAPRLISIEALAVQRLPAAARRREERVRRAG